MADTETILAEFDAEFGASEQSTAGNANATNTIDAVQPTTGITPKFRREIDLGDGSGVQVFEGDTAEALIDKLAAAQANATRKIREQNRRLKRQREAASNIEPAVASEPVKPLTADELMALSQQFEHDPVAVFNRLTESQFGLRPAEIRQQLDEFRAMRQEQAEVAQFEQDCQEFIEDHPDYYVCPANYNKIIRYIERNNLEHNLDSLEEAFEELSSSGLLEQKPQSTPPAATAQPAATRIEPKPQKRVITSLSDRPGEPAATEPLNERTVREMSEKALYAAKDQDEARRIVNELQAKIRALQQSQ